MQRHITVYRESGRYAGWPANYGIWSWDDEIVVCFTLGYFDKDTPFHTRDKTRPFTTMQARSMDGGVSWRVQPMPCRTPGDRALSADEHMLPELGVDTVLDDPATPNRPAPCPGDIDFTHPDFALMCARSGLKFGARSWFYLSTDRCRSWRGPYRLPQFAQKGIAARTDYLVNGPQDCLFFLTAAWSAQQEGRVFCARTSDGGQTFQFVAWVGPEPEGYQIMPSSAPLPGGAIVTALRRRAPDGRCWIDLYKSGDAGHSWQFVSQPAEHTGFNGNPPALIQLRDGRLCLTYGYRDRPYGIRAVLSADEGATWGDPIVLRADGGDPDLGYPRTVQRADGRIVTVYYFNDSQYGDRYIAATIWTA